MVTIRRDIAAKMEMGAMGASMGLNAYDALIMEKNERRAASYEMPSYLSADVAECFRSPEEKVEEPKATKSPEKPSIDPKKSYEDYMLEELHRTTNTHRILTQTEYVNLINGMTEAPVKEEPEVAKSKNNETAVGKLTKGGKIFVMIYVLLIAVVAFVLIAVNTFAKQSPAMAGTEADPDAVEVMSIESESTSGNWFDKLCDAISAK